MNGRRAAVDRPRGGQRVRTLALSLALLPAAVVAAGAPARPAATDPAALLQGRLEAGSGTAAVAVLIDDAGAVTLHTVGTATPRTRFELGSITKAMTGSLLARLAMQGRIDLDAPIGRWWPEIDGRPAGALTLRQLATHRSGLPRVPRDAAMLWSGLRRPQDPYAGYTAADLQAWLQGWEGAATVAFEYSNAGFGVIGQVLERATGQGYAALLQREVLEPAGLARATLQADAVQGHDAQGWPTAAWRLGPFAAAGALRADAEDVAMLLQAARRREPPFDAGAERAQAERGGVGRSVGLGWMRTERDTGSGMERIVWHNGGTGGHRAFLGFSEVSGRAVAVMANGHAALDDLGMHLLNPAFALSPPGRPPIGPAAWLSLLLPLAALAGLARSAWRPAATATLAETALRGLTALAVLAVLARLGDFRPWTLGTVSALPVFALATLGLTALAMWRFARPAAAEPAARGGRRRTAWAAVNLVGAGLLAAWAWGV